MAYCSFRPGPLASNYVWRFPFLHPQGNEVQCIFAQPSFFYNGKVTLDLINLEFLNIKLEMFVLVNVRQQLFDRIS